MRKWRRTTSASALARGEHVGRYIRDGQQTDHLHDVKTLHFVKGKRRYIGRWHETHLDERPLHPRRVRADVDLDVAYLPLLPACSLQVAQQEANHFVTERDQLEDAD